MKEQSLSEAFNASIKKGVVTGCLSFPNQFCSQIQIYSAAKQWEHDSKGLIYASVRTGNDDFISLDFRFDENVEHKEYHSILYDYLKPLFKEKLGDDYIKAWSISRESLIVK